MLDDGLAMDDVYVVDDGSYTDAEHYCGCHRDDPASIPALSLRSAERKHKQLGRASVKQVERKRVPWPVPFRTVINECHCESEEAQADIENRFRGLATLWISETRHMSSLNQISRHPAFREIVAMGTKVLPFVMRDLERKPYHWFWVLHSITGARPVPESACGKVDEAIRAWVAWAPDAGCNR